MARINGASRKRKAVIGGSLAPLAPGERGWARNLGNVRTRCLEGW
ncbi:hypothetical protein B4113_0593 [Geobacillus sp. B4113_201601]|nr:hypothetical protein B4113_0593 [Geobacillus sp. B4113_201601]